VVKCVVNTHTPVGVNDGEHDDEVLEEEEVDKEEQRKVQHLVVVQHVAGVCMCVCVCVCARARA
jgi:hypothetical protein